METQEVCDCGGHLRPAKLDTYDFSRYVGFKVTLRGMDVLRCESCGWATLDGTMINTVLHRLVVDFTRFPRRLNANEAKYLRRSIDATQEELASRMGIVRETVAKWECDDQTISPQHDFILRMLALGGMVGRGLMTHEIAGEILAENFRAVRSNPPREITPAVDMSGIGPSNYYEQSPEKKLAAAG